MRASPIVFRSLFSILLIGCLTLTFAACRRPPTVEEQTQEETSVVSGTDSNEFTGSVTDLMKSGKDVTCTFTREDEGMTMDGTVYVARNGRMAGEFAMQSAQFGKMTMHVIRDGSYGYTWGYPSATEGTKIKLDAEGKPMKKEKENGPSVDDPMDYNCSSWRVDTSMFVPPSDVNFR